jgi:two-component system, NarL family, nitrate/nitrite response regulator NarL
MRALDRAGIDVSPAGIVAPAVRVAIITEVRLYREGLAHVLAAAGMEVAGSATDADTVAECVLTTRPDVILLDMAMPGWESAMEALNCSGSKTDVVALGVLETAPDILACAEAGVDGYLPRSASAEDLVNVLHGVARGEVMCPPSITGSLFRRIGALALERRPAMAVGRLTARELEIVDLIDEGLSNKQIARRLCIEHSTVKNHVHNVLEKLDVHRRSEAAAWVRQRSRPLRI